MRAVFPTCLLTGLALSLCLALPAAAVTGGGFSLVATPGQEDASGYVRMRDGQVYEICFGSQLDRRSDVSISVDGLPMGVFRLPPHGNWCVQRPRNEQGRFTFYRAGSAGGLASGSASVGPQDRGIVRATFTPELAHRLQPSQRPRLEPLPHTRNAPGAGAPPPPPTYAPDMAAESELSSGVTGLTGRSDQSFSDAERITPDHANAVTLELRLVHDSALERPEEPRPLPGRFDRLAPPPILR